MARAPASTIATARCDEVNASRSRRSRSAIATRSACSRRTPAVVGSPCLLELFGRGHRTFAADAGGVGAVHPVEHQPGQRHRLLGQPVGEVGGLAQRVTLGRGHDDERRARLLEQVVGALGPLAEAAERRLDRRDERAHVAQQLAAEHLGQHAGEEPDAGAEHLTYARPPALAGATSTRSSRPSRKVAMPPRRVEEVERRAGRRGVDDDQVPLPVALSWPSFSMAMYSCVPEKLEDIAT